MIELKELLKRYKILLYWGDEDEAYLAEMPELPGCITDGATPEAAIANLYEAAALWIETAVELGRPIPVPMQLSGELNTDAQSPQATQPYSSRVEGRDSGSVQVAASCPAVSGAKHSGKRKAAADQGVGKSRKRAK